MRLVDFTAVLEESKEVLKQCFNKYQLHEVFLSFNGGKDCTVLLDVTLNLLQTIYNNETGRRLKVIYIRTNNPFVELEEFVKEIEIHYGTKMIVAEGEMKTTLQRIMERDRKLKACLMGTRRTDPYSEDLKFMQKTDPSWPPILRVSPLLNWSYHQIWSYILQRQIPYCKLYDRGYTSIGSTMNTWPNPALAFTDSPGCVSHHPAWELPDGALERAGRGSPPEHSVNGHGTCNDLQENGLVINKGAQDEIL